MSDLVITRVFRAGIDHVYDYISKPEHVADWWGPEGMTCPEHALALGRIGPWHSTMQAPDGRQFHVSGEVTDVDPPNRVAFTWAWRQEDGSRGPESRVEIALEPVGDATRFTMTHSGLVDEAAATSHREGWESTLRKLAALIPMNETAD